MDDKIEKVKTADLIPYKNNPRDNDGAVKYVAKSIKAFGFKQPIVVDKDNIVVAGHTRLKASIQLGLEEVPVIRADDLTPEEIQAYRVADNRTGELAKWDYEKLREELGEIKDIDMRALGFDTVFFDDPDSLEEGQVAEDEVKPRSKKGDLFQLGRHRLMCGDSTDRKMVDALMGGAVCDLLVTDPPYGVSYEKKEEMLRNTRMNARQDAGHSYIAQDTLSPKKLEGFLYRAFSLCFDYIKPGGAYYIWYTSFSTNPFYRAIERAGEEVRQTLTWVKDRFVLGVSDYHQQSEACIYGWKKGAGHYFTWDRTQSMVFEDRPNFNRMSKQELIRACKSLYDRQFDESDVLRADKPVRSRYHPTEKPIKLIGRLIANSSREGEKVLDVFGGSGTTLLACEQMDRSCYMMELDEYYTDVIIHRWEEFTGEKAKKINEPMKGGVKWEPHSIQDGSHRTV